MIRKMIKPIKYILLVMIICLDGYLIYHSFLKGNASSDYSEKTTEVVVDTVEKIDPNKENILSKIDFNKLHLIVRKLFGHFGAFLICGLIFTLMILLFIKNNYLRFFLIITHGILLAGLTEFIQLHIEGRYGSLKDVMIDMAGYLVPVIITLVIMIVTYFIKKAITKQNLKEGEINYE